MTFPAKSTARTTKRFRAITIGDSHSQNGQQNLGTISSIVVSGGIATFVLANACNVYAGNIISLYYSGDTNFTNPLNGANLPILSMSGDYKTFTVSAATPTGLLADGNYTSQVAQWAAVVVNCQSTDWSFYHWFNCFMRGRFKLVANYSFGGSLSDTALGLTKQALAGYAFDYVFFSTGTNNINNNASTVANAIAAADTAYAHIVASVTKFTDAGKVVLLHVPPPINIVAGANHQNKNIAITYLRNRLISLDHNNDLVEIIDAYGTVVNGLYPVGGSDYAIPNTIETTAGVHLTTRGIFSLVKNSIAAGFSNLANTIGSAPISQLDSTTYAQPQARANIVTNAGMAGTVAASQTGWTGTFPTGWQLRAATASSAHVGTGQATRYAQPNSNTVNHGYAFQVASTWTTAAENYSFWSANIGGGMVAGNWYRGSIDVTVTAQANTSLVLLSGISLAIWINGLSNFAGRYYGGGNTTENGLPFAIGDVVTIYSEPFFVPVGTSFAGGVLLITQVNNNGVAGTMTLQFSSPDLRICDDPRA